MELQLCVGSKKAILLLKATATEINTTTGLFLWKSIQPHGPSVAHAGMLVNIRRSEYANRPKIMGSTMQIPNMRYIVISMNQDPYSLESIVFYCKE